MGVATALIVGFMVGVLVGFFYAALVVAAHSREEDQNENC